MKTTIKTATGRIVAEPLPGGTVQLTIDNGNGFTEFATVELTLDQAGVMIFALEQAAEAAKIAQEREADHFSAMYPQGITA